MVGLLKLIRIRTLLFVIFTMYIIRLFVLRPALNIYDLDLQMDNFSFAMLVAAVCFMVASAYTINDYFDTASDRISGVRDVVVERVVSRQTAIMAHTLFTILSVGIAFWLSYTVGAWRMGIFFILASGVLWFYSTSYKHFFITGNLIVAIMMAMIPLIVVFFEIAYLTKGYASLLLSASADFMYLFYYAWGFAGFIFITILIYEISKDLYTTGGDMEAGSETIPLVLGEKMARCIIASLAVIAAAGSLVVYFTFLNMPIQLAYINIALVIPYLTLAYLVVTSKGGRGIILSLIRLIMVLVISFAFLLYV